MNERKWFISKYRHKNKYLIWYQKILYSNHAKAIYDNFYNIHIDNLKIGIVNIF